MTMNSPYEKVSEGKATTMVEQQTAKVPSLGYFSLAIGSMLISATLALFMKKRELGNFVGLWAPSFLLMGVYNKLVKLEADVERRSLH